MSAPVVVLTLVLLLGIQPVTTDLYLPALPSLATDLHAHTGQAQLTLSALVIAFGVGQLVCGPLADRFGRRPVLLGGLALYTVASVLSALAPSVGWLIGWRTLQGAAMAAAVTCGRSVVRDLFLPHDGARVMSRALGGFGAIAMLSPVAGGLVVQAAGWQATLLLPALFGAGTLAFVARRFDETLQRPNPAATQPAVLVRNWLAVLANPGFRAWAALLAASFAGIFTFLATASFIFIDVLHQSRAVCGVAVASSSVAYIAGTWLCRRLLVTHGMRRAVRLGGLLSLAGGATLALLSLAGVQSAWAILLPQAVYAVGHGIHQPCGQAGAVGPFPDKAGTAAALSGFLMMATAFAIGLAVGPLLNGTVFPLTLGVGASSVVVALVAWTLVQRHGEPPRAAAASVTPAAG